MLQLIRLIFGSKCRWANKRIVLVQRIGTVLTEKRLLNHWTEISAEIETPGFAL
jgi:hypothetical protein